MRLLTKAFHPHWSPAGDRIAVVKEALFQEGAYWDLPIYTVAPDGNA